MPRFSPYVLLSVFAAAALFVTGCGASKPLPQQQTPAETAQQPQATERKTPSPEQEVSEEPNATCRSETAIRESERNRAACFHLQPGATSTKVVKEQVPVKSGAKASAPAKKGTKANAKPQMVTVTKEVKTTGRCQPQSLIYARCRTGIATCKLGDTSPVQWFACAKKNNATTSIPVAGSVIVLDVNSRRGMPTGHPAYVEEVRKNGDGTWTLRISHTNYDRKCHLDQDAAVMYDPKRMTASFMSGPWATWAKDLKALGFILR
jgi:hypothetical protein